MLGGVKEALELTGIRPMAWSSYHCCCLLFVVVCYLLFVVVVVVVVTVERSSKRSPSRLLIFLKRATFVPARPFGWNHCHKSITIKVHHTKSLNYVFKCVCVCVCVNVCMYMV